MPSEEKKMNVYQRINEVRKTNAYIKKNKEIDGKYMVVTHDQVTAEIRDDLITHGVVIVPWLDGEPSYADTLRMMGKNPIFQVRGTYIVRFVNMDDPKDLCEVRVAAAADDAGDKGPGKLISYAVKMAILKLFNIETGDREEERVTGDGSSRMEAKELADWKARIDGIASAEEGTKVWSEIIVACNKTGDENAITLLRTYLSVVSTKKGFKSGQQRLKRNTTGGADERTATH